MATTFDSSAGPLPLSNEEIVPKPFREGRGYANMAQRLSVLPLLPIMEKPIWGVLMQTLSIFLVLIGSSMAGVPTITLATLPLFILAIIAGAAIDAWYGVLLFLIYSAVEGLYKYTSEYSAIVYSTAPVVVVGVYLCWALSPARKTRELTKPENTQPPLAPGIYAFAVLCLLQMFNPEALGLITGLATAIVWYVGPILLFVVAYNATKSSQQIITLLYLIVGISIIVSAYAIVQFSMGGAWCYEHLHGYRLINQLGFGVIDEHGKYQLGSFRPGSTFGGAGAYVLFVSCGIVGALALILMDKTKIWQRVLLVIGIVIMAIAMLLSATRSILVILLLIAPVCMLLNARSLKDTINTYFAMVFVSVIAAIVFLFTVWFAGGVIATRFNKTLSNPFAAYQKERSGHLVRFLDQVTIRPLGIGMQRGTELQHFERSSLPPEDAAIMADRESQWNTLQIDTGILGVGLIVGVFAGLIRFYILYQGRLPDARLRTCFVALFCMILLYLLSTLAGPVLQSAYLFWIAAGVMLAIPKVATNEIAQRMKLWESLQTDTGGDAARRQLLRQQLRTAGETMGASIVTQTALQGITDNAAAASQSQQETHQEEEE